MSDPFIGEVRIFTYNFVPLDWMPCDGSEYPVAQYQALYAIIGNTFGGTYPNTFKVPDLRGRAVSGAGTGPGLTPRSLGNNYGSQTATLTASQLPAHTHQLQRKGAKTPGDKTASPSNTSDLGTLGIVASGQVTNMLTFQNTGNPNTSLHPSTIGTAVTSTGNPADQAQPLPHNNMQPYQAIQFCIASAGIFPTWE